ncbi:MAG TPA: efflux RND transporter periplasmic adaptor subunit [Chthoniobacterales bacterium]|nr:efflux RND transporter periplasmic adaptor subunit [Chthoniobacterales bacterium]
MRRLRWLFILVGAVFIAGIWYFFGHENAPQGGVDASKAKASGQSQAGGPGGPVPVVAGAVQKRDVPIYLDGIGTVQAYNTVTVHPQISGILTQVAFREGQDVKKGDLLAVIDPRPYQATLDGAIAKKNEDLAQLNNAKVLLGRDTDLFKKGALDNQTYDTQRFLADQLDATVKADQAAIDSAQTQLSYTQITAPFDGRCGIRLVDQGNLVTPTSSLVVITQLKPISVLFTLPQQDVLDVNEAFAKGPLIVIALDSTQSKPLENGTLTVVDNQINTTTGTIQLKADFPNQNLRLWPGQFVNARLLVSTRPNGLIVPASVIQRGPEGTYAYVIRASKTVEMRPVKVAQIDGGQALIDSGLQVGEQVVVDGQYKLQPGARVIIQPTQRGNTGQLTESSETVPQTQGAGAKQVPVPDGAKEHQPNGVSSQQPAARTAPAIPTQG